MVTKKTKIIFIICLILITSTNYVDATNSNYKQLASIEAFEGEMIVENNGVIEVYNCVNEIIELTGKEDYKKKYPSWDGEIYHKYIYKWNKKLKKYYLVKNYFADIHESKVMNSDIKTLDVSEKSWSNVLPEVDVKAYEIYDVNNDGEEEVVVFSRKKNKEDNIFLPGQLFILGLSKGNFKIVASLDTKNDFSYSVWGEFTRLLDLQVRDVNNDGIVEILVWSLCPGGSGYTTMLDIFALDNGQNIILGDFN